MHVIFLDGNRPLWYMLPLSPRGNTRYFLDSNRSLWYILLRYSATTVIYGIFYILYFFGLLPRACGVGTFTEHEKHQTLDLIMKYSGEHNKRQCPDHRQTFAANSCCVCVFSSHLFRTSNSLKVPAGVTQDFSSTFLLRCVPLSFPRQGFSRSLPSSTGKSN